MAVDEGDEATKSDANVPTGEHSPTDQPVSIYECDRALREAAVGAMREFQRQNRITTGGMTIKQMIEEGRP